MNSFYRAVASLGAICLSLCTPAAAQLRGDGEACLESSGQAHLDEAYCRRALSRQDLAPVERAALLTARASALLSLGDATAAGAALANALVLNPASAKAYLLRGLMRRGAMEYDQGSVLGDLNQAIALNPFYTDALAYRGALHFQAGDLPAALANYDRALALQPRSSQALFYKGVLHFQQGDFALAGDRFREVLALAPVQHPIAALWLAAAVARQGGDARAALKPYSWWWEDGTWPAPLVQLWAGATDLSPVMAVLAAQGGDARAQGAFFIAQWHLAKGNVVAGQEWLGKVRAHPTRHMLEVIVATGVPGN